MLHIDLDLKGLAQTHGATDECTGDDTVLTDDAGAPRDVIWQYAATSGLFLKWDVITGSYQSVGVNAVSEGETVCWSDQAPVANAQNPVITIDVLDALTQEAIGQATLTLTVDGDGYLVTNEALNGV